MNFLEFGIKLALFIPLLNFASGHPLVKDIEMIKLNENKMLALPDQTEVVGIGNQSKSNKHIKVAGKGIGISEKMNADYLRLNRLILS